MYIYIYIVYSHSEVVFIISIHIHDFEFSLFVKELLGRLMNYIMGVSMLHYILHVGIYHLY
jgi:hypothetical protein